MSAERSGLPSALSPPRASLALGLSLALPGLGLVYAGAPLRGLLALCFAVLGLGGILDGIDNYRHRPEYLYFGIAGALALAVAWLGGAWHARRLAQRFGGWPAPYRFLARPDVRASLWAARLEIVFTAMFAGFAVVFAVLPALPRWLPEPTRYWFVYEALGSLYVAVFHAVAKEKAEGTPGAGAACAFLVVTLLGTLAAATLTAVPREALVLAWILALPSCWYSLRQRGAQPAAIHAQRFLLCLVAGVLAFIAFGMAVEAWSGITRTPQYRMRLLAHDAFVLAVLGACYYALRTAVEIVLHRAYRHAVLP